MLLGLGGAVEERGLLPNKGNLSYFSAVINQQQRLLLSQIAETSMPLSLEDILVFPRAVKVQVLRSSNNLIPIRQRNWIDRFQVGFDFVGAVYKGWSRVFIGRWGIIAFVKKIDSHFVRKGNYISMPNNVVSRGLATIGDAQTSFNVFTHIGLKDFQSHRFNGNISPQLRAAYSSRFSKGHEQHSSADHADYKAPKSVLSRIPRRIRSLPLSTKVAAAFIMSLYASHVLIRGADRAADGGGDRISGLVQAFCGCCLVGLIFALWSLSGPY